MPNRVPGPYPYFRVELSKVLSNFPPINFSFVRPFIMTILCFSHHPHNIMDFSKPFISRRKVFLPKPKQLP